MNTQIRLLPVLAAVAIGAFAIRAISIAEAAGEANTETAPQEQAADANYQAAVPVNDTYADEAQSEAHSDEASCAQPDFLAEQAGLSQYEIEVLRNLADRRDALDERAASLDTRELTVSAAEVRLNDQIDELSAMEARIEGLLEQLEQKDNAQMDNLVRVYESMKPKDAARIFDTLDNDLMLSMADRMKPAAMAAILSNMEQDRARTLTTLIALKTTPPETLEELEARTGEP